MKKFTRHPTKNIAHHGIAPETEREKSELTLLHPVTLVGPSARRPPQIHAKLRFEFKEPGSASFAFLHACICLLLSVIETRIVPGVIPRHHDILHVFVLRCRSSVSLVNKDIHLRHLHEPSNACGILGILGGAGNVPDVDCAGMPFAALESPATPAVKFNGVDPAY
jgi:hypothetical protein